MDQSSINVPDFSTGDELPLIKDENGDQVCRTLHNFFLVINLPFLVLDDANVLAWCFWRSLPSTWHSLLVWQDIHRIGTIVRQLLRNSETHWTSYLCPSARHGNVFHVSFNVEMSSFGTFLSHRPSTWKRARTWRNKLVSWTFMKSSTPGLPNVTKFSSSSHAESPRNTPLNHRRFPAKANTWKWNIYPTIPLCPQIWKDQHSATYLVPTKPLWKTFY